MTTETAIFWVKLIHTVITLVNTGAVFYILWCGITGRQDRWLVVALILIAAETIALIAFGLVCPLQLLMRHLEGVEHGVHDMFLPGWFASNIVQVMTPLTVIGLILVARNHWRRRGQPQR